LLLPSKYAGDSVILYCVVVVCLFVPSLSSCHEKQRWRYRTNPHSLRSNKLPSVPDASLTFPS